MNGLCKARFISPECQSSHIDQCSTVQSVHVPLKASLLIAFPLDSAGNILSKVERPLPAPSPASAIL